MEVEEVKSGRPLGPTSRLLSSVGVGPRTLERSSGSDSSPPRSSVPEAKAASSSALAGDDSFLNLDLLSLTLALPLSLLLPLPLEEAGDFAFEEKKKDGGEREGDIFATVGMRNTE